MKYGYDSWDISGWACAGDNDSVDDDDIRREGYEAASGTSISIEAMDAFVMMRVAQIIYEGKVEQAIEDAANSERFGGNFGSGMLRKNAAKLREVLAQIELEPAVPYVWNYDENGKLDF